MGSFHSFFQLTPAFWLRKPRHVFSLRGVVLPLWCSGLLHLAGACCWRVGLFDLFCVLHRGEQADIARNQEQVTDLPLLHNLTLRRRQPYQFEFTKPQNVSNIMMLCVCLRECMADRPNIQSKCL